VAALILRCVTGAVWIVLADRPRTRSRPRGRVQRPSAGSSTLVAALRSRARTAPPEP